MITGIGAASNLLQNFEAFTNQNRGTKFNVEDFFLMKNGVPGSFDG
jgi:hypothetical protein